MLALHVVIPFISGALSIAVPAPKKTGCAGSSLEAIHTLNCGGRGLLLPSTPGLVKVFRPPTIPGLRLTVAVALPSYGTLASIVNLPPLPLLLGSLPPAQSRAVEQTLKLYLSIVKLAVL